METITEFDKHKTFTQWVNLFGDALYSWAFHKISDEALAQDLVQETFVAAYQNLANFKKASSPKTWLFGILKNKIIDHYRLRAKTQTTSMVVFDEPTAWFDENDQWKKENRPQPWSASEEHLLDNPEFEIILGRCIGNLPVPWSACVQLKYLGEKESDEICQQLNITATNLWQILHRAKLRLRNCLEKNWFKAVML